MAKIIVRKPASPATEKPMIPAVVVLSEAGNRLKRCEAILDSADSMFAAISAEDDQNQWALGMSYIATGVRDEIKEIREYLDKMIIKGGPGGEALGIEKGGA